MSKPQLFGEANDNIELLPRETFSGRALILLAIVAPSILPYKLEIGENITVPPTTATPTWL